MSLHAYASCDSPLSHTLLDQKLDSRVIVSDMNFRNHKKFFKDPVGYYQNDTRWGKWLAKNINFFDLGFSNELTDESEINAAIDEIIKQFDFIMISDYMDESLILLKEELCLQISDIVFFSINKRSDPMSAPRVYLGCPRVNLECPRVSARF